jgi:hypothetical protein
MKNPCKNCIVLPICKSKVGGASFIPDLRCELFDKYILYADRSNIEETREILGAKKSMELPCEKCVVLPICKSKYSFYQELSIRTIYRIINNCPILQELYDGDSPWVSISVVPCLEKVFKRKRTIEYIEELSKAIDHDDILPCIDCITFPICKAVVNDGVYIGLHELTKKCILFKLYVKRNLYWNDVFHTDRFKEFQKYFGLEWVDYI